MAIPDNQHWKYISIWELKVLLSITKNNSNFPFQKGYSNTLKIQEQLTALHQSLSLQHRSRKSWHWSRLRVQRGRERRTRWETGDLLRGPTTVPSLCKVPADSINQETGKLEQSYRLALSTPCQDHSLKQFGHIFLYGSGSPTMASVQLSWNPEQAMGHPCPTIQTPPMLTRQHPKCSTTVQPPPQQ